jgi:hypothetical protein
MYEFIGLNQKSIEIMSPNVRESETLEVRNLGPGKRNVKHVTMYVTHLNVKTHSCKIVNYFRFQKYPIIQECVFTLGCVADIVT